MKINRIMCFLMVMCIFSFASCSNTKDVTILDRNSNKVVAELSTKENTSEVAKLLDACNHAEKSNNAIHAKEEYLVHFIDPKDSQYDIWFDVYINERNDVYIQYDKEKMENLNDFNKNNMNYDLMKCNNMTVSEFNEIITAAKK
ncbi:MAG: hypothetical protein K6F76_07840 [Clostridiales bacterium]|nr:hypothetical protein [Clostridiales bacterium]